MKNSVIFAAKAIGVWLAVIIGQMAGGMLTQKMMPATPVQEGPFSLMQAMLLVAALHALVLAVFAARLRGGFLARLLTVFAVFFMLDTGLSTIEAWYFNSFIKMSDAALLGMALSGGIKAAVAALASALLWKGSSDPAPQLGGLWWKIALIVPLYVVAYFTAGALIAFQGEAVRAYYGQGLNIDQAQLALLQVGRGVIWAGLALLIVKTAARPRLAVVVLTGALFALLMALTLLYPNPLMLWPVRQYHLVEILVSNSLFGAAAAWILTMGKRG